MQRTDSANPRGSYQPPLPTKPTLKRQNAALGNDSQNTLEGPSTPTQLGKVNIPSGTAEHASAKRFKSSHPPAYVSSPYKAPEPVPHTLVASCGNPTYRKVTMKGEHAGRAYIACPCNNGAFIWEDTWQTKCHSNADMKLTCRAVGTAQASLPEELKEFMEQVAGQLEGLFIETDQQLHTFTDEVYSLLGSFEERLKALETPTP